MILTDDKSTEAQQNSHPTEQAPPAYEEIQPASSRNRQRTPVSPRSQAHAGPSSFFISNPEPRPLQHSTSYPPTSQYSAGSSSYAPSSAQLSSSSGNALYLARSQYAPGPAVSIPDRRLIHGECVIVLLDPPPPSFRRPPAPELPYPSFEPTALMGLSGNLSTAFPLLAPPSTADPHPFITHDVSEQDWTFFVRDVKAAALLAPSNSMFAGVAPVHMRLPPIINLIVAKTLEHHWQNKQNGPSGEVVEYWNHHFFYPRRMRVVLARGAVSYSGPDAPPPDRRSASSKDVPTDSPVSDSASGSYKGDKRSHKAAKAELKQQKKQRESERSEAASENWRLVVASYTP